MRPRFTIRGYRTPASSPTTTPTAPIPPSHLSDAARAEWDRLLPLLRDAGRLKAIDADQLALYCTAYARWAEAEKQIAESGTVVKSPNGYPVQNPYLSIANKAMQQMHQYLAKFGMKPADQK
ncbi:MAG TPA: phage terminase small subunit P27 family [Tepidisphaeraceae bacterium]|jgi:P27 family predicted phage terminase small subunit|nr:phage terminase small subunit P27 family [Tepidisphaeraceae bacterium]